MKLIIMIAVCVLVLLVGCGQSEKKASMCFDFCKEKGYMISMHSFVEHKNSCSCLDEEGEIHIYLMLEKGRDNVFVRENIEWCANDSCATVCAKFERNECYKGNESWTWDTVVNTTICREKNPCELGNPLFTWECDNGENWQICVGDACTEVFCIEGERICIEIKKIDFGS